MVLCGNKGIVRLPFAEPPLFSDILLGFYYVLSLKLQQIIFRHYFPGNSVSHIQVPYLLA